MKIFHFVLLLCCGNISYGQNEINQRVKRITEYTLHSFNIPEQIDTSKATKFGELIYHYEDEKLIAVHRKVLNYKTDEFNSEYDSVFYLGNDSVQIKRTRNNSEYTEYQKLFNWLKIKSSFDEKSPFKFKSDYHRLTIYRKNTRKRLNFTRKYIDGDIEYKLTYHFDAKGRISAINELRLDNNVEGWYRFKYEDNSNFSISSGSGEVWHTSTIYRFDEKGMLNFIGDESDTNASFTLIEYESGKGNSSSIYSDIYDIIYYKPLIK